MTARTKIMVLPHAENLPAPAVHATEFDLVAAIANFSPMPIWPGERAAIPTGLVIALPRGFEGQIRPRTGLALRHGVTVLNSPGTVRSDYRGEVQVILINHGNRPFMVEHGTPIAILVVTPVATIDWELVPMVEEDAA